MLAFFAYLPVDDRGTFCFFLPSYPAFYGNYCVFIYFRSESNKEFILLPLYEHNKKIV